MITYVVGSDLREMDIIIRKAKGGDERGVVLLNDGGFKEGEHFFDIQTDVNSDDDSSVLLRVAYRRDQTYKIDRMD